MPRHIQCIVLIYIFAILNIPQGSFAQNTKGRLSFVETHKRSNPGLSSIVNAWRTKVSQDGAFVYLSSNSGISIFSRNISSGTLSHLANSPISGTAQAIILSPNEDYLYCTAGHGIAVFSRNTSTGLLTLVEVHQEGVDGVFWLSGAHSLTLSPDGAHLYVASWQDDLIAAYLRNSDSGKLTFIEYKKNEVDGISGLDGAYAVAISPDGGHVYVASIYDNSLTVFGRNESSGRLEFIEQFRNFQNGINHMQSPSHILVSADGNQLYVAGQNGNSIILFCRNTSSGKLDFVEEYVDSKNDVDGLRQVEMLAISSDGYNFYATGAADNSIAIFSRNKYNGQLSFVDAIKNEINGIFGLYEPRGLAISPDGKNLYSTGPGTYNAVTVFTRDISNATPTASFIISPDSGTTDTYYFLNASESWDAEDDSLDIKVRWDWENDGIWDTDWTATKTTNHQYNSAGIYTVKLEVKDTGGLTGTATRSVTVEIANTAPVIVPVLLPDATEGVPFLFVIEASDINQEDRLIFDYLEGPVWLKIDSSGILSGIPSNGDVGIDIPVSIRVTDSGNLADTLNTTISVLNINAPPVISTTSLPDATEGLAYSFAVEASDIDQGDKLSFEILSGPAWLKIDTSGTLTGIPANEDVGNDVPVSIRVADSGNLADTLTTTINVLNINDKPVIMSFSPPKDTIIIENDSALFSVTATDIDNDTLSYTWFLDEEVVGDFFIIVPDSASSLWLKFPFGSRGVHSLRVLILDGESSADKSWSIIVEEIRSEPEKTILITVPADTGRISLNFSNDCSVLLNFTGGEYINKTLSIKQIRSLSDSLPDIPSFEKTVGYYDITLDSDNFEAELSFGYTDSLLAVMDIIEDSLAVSVYDSADYRDYMWRVLPSQIEKADNIVTVTTNHFSLWAVTSKEETIISRIDETNAHIPTGFRLLQNYPNPFNPTTRIEFEIPKRTWATVRIYNLLGQEVRTLFHQNTVAGRYIVEWDGRDEIGRTVSSGIYLYQLHTDSFVETKKLLLLK